jgi:hypothetical protein
VHRIVAEDAGCRLGEVAVGEQRHRPEIGANRALLELRAAKRRTSAWFLRPSRGKSYLLLALTGLPPSCRIVFASRSACSL